MNRPAVLVIDDNAINLALISYLLEAAGCEVRSAEQGEAQERILAAGFDAYLSKPIEPASFIVTLKSLVPHLWAEPPQPAPSRSPQPLAPPPAACRPDHPGARRQPHQPRAQAQPAAAARLALGAVRYLQRPIDSKALLAEIRRCLSIPRY